MTLLKNALNYNDLRPELALENVVPQQVDFFDLQTRATSAIKQFLANSHRTLLVLKTDEQGEVMKFVEDFVTQQWTPSATPIGVHYEVQMDPNTALPKVSMRAANNPSDNFCAKQRVASALHFDQFRLFGSVTAHHSTIQLNAGLVHQVMNGGVLILNVEPFLSQFDLWLRLKNLLLTQQFDWYSSHPYKSLPCDIPSCPINLKVILLGNREELAAFESLESSLYLFADYSEIEGYYGLENPHKQQQWSHYIQSFAQQYGLQLTPCAINKCYQLLVRETEDCHWVSISPLKLQNMLLSTATLVNKTQLSAVDFQQFFAQQQLQQDVLKQQSHTDILREQVYVATEGEAIGQVNGLSVIEYPGTPIVFGEPTRLSCIVQFGEGELIDVERKNELAGNIHSKGMMIAQSCLAQILALPAQLPFSASLVFEQSYSEIDGDSASLASFCALVSALSAQPLPQSIAITGTIDQFGLVHSVGGVNEKIEGFFAICAARGLTGKQGVIIPAASLCQLSLTEEVVSAVQNQQFFILPAEDVYQVCEWLFQRDLVEEDKDYQEDNQPLSRLIQQRIEQRGDQGNAKASWFSRLCQKF